MARKELLTQDFENTMKYFRVNIPKRLRNEENSKYFMKTVCNIKIKKLSKYEKEWGNLKEAERLAEDPLTRYQRENKKLMADNLRLERENDVLAQELLTSKISMRVEMDQLEDLKEGLEKDLHSCRNLLTDTRGEKQMLSEEAEQLKLVLKRELEKLEAELASKENIITDYKEITGKLSDKLERREKGGEQRKPSVESQPLDSALSRVQELELELAQTKLALVETECKNQDLAHQFTTQEVNRNSTWFAKTLTSIKEAAGPRPSPLAAAANSSRSADMKKSSSEHITLGHSRSNSKS